MTDSEKIPKLTYQRIPINKMRTITIDILNEKAIKLLQDLEELNLIRMFNKMALWKIPPTLKRKRQIIKE